jgi:hypothetical protein
MRIKDGSLDLMVAREKRDRALACAFLSLIIAGAMVISNVGPDQKTDEALAIVRQNRELLAQNQSALRSNQAEFARDQMALRTLLSDRIPAH